MSRIRSPVTLWLPLGLLCACLSLPGMGCKQKAELVAVPLGKLPELPPPPPEDVVATVNGHPISVAEVAAQARARGTPAQQALSDLISAELLAQEAERRGLVNDRAVQRARDEEGVRRFLATDFEKNYTADNAIPAEILKKAYQSMQWRMVHGQLKEVSHIVALTPKPNPEAQQLIEEVLRRAQKVKTEEEFRNLAMAPDLQETSRKLNLNLHAEHLVTARKGVTVEDFAKAAFDLQKPGEISPVVHTSFGYHVIWLSQTVEPENVGLEEATPKIRREIWPELRKRVFRDYQEQLAKQHKVQTFPDRLPQLQDPGDLPDPEASH